MLTHLWLFSLAALSISFSLAGTECWSIREEPPLTDLMDPELSSAGLQLSFCQVSPTGRRSWELLDRELGVHAWHGQHFLVFTFPGQPVSS